ncbi:MAG: hypothetical protein ACXWDM_01515 [Nocardioides sp.]
MLETGARAGEVVALQVADVDLVAGSATIRRGKAMTRPRRLCPGTTSTPAAHGADRSPKM